jgi:hypothetical protein
VVEPFLSTKLTLDCWMGSLNVALIALSVGTLVADVAGECAVTVGAVVSATAVVNDHAVEVIVLPNTSCAPLNVAVYTVPVTRLLLG